MKHIVDVADKLKEAVNAQAVSTVAKEQAEIVCMTIDVLAGLLADIHSIALSLQKIADESKAIADEIAK